MSETSDSARERIAGIHHVTAITGDAQRNVDFYTHLLGLRLVKVTVNFDDPGAYHFYYGDEAGHPGTILTFFAWQDAPRGRVGTGQTTALDFAVPSGALTFWTERLRAAGVQVAAPQPRFDGQALAFADPDGLALALVAAERFEARDAWAGGPVPAEAAIRGFAGVTMSERGAEGTLALLTETMGFAPAGEAPDRVRVTTPQGETVEVIHEPAGRMGTVAAGSVHHVAWRAPDDAAQLAWRERLIARGLHVTPVLDREYFHSIYFREPGGALFEVATDPPGFTVDEPLDRLGASLMLPPWLEPQRAQILQALPPVRGVNLE